MIAFVLDLGPGLVALLTPLVTAGVVWLTVGRKVSHEMKPNSGKSMRDVMDRVEAKTNATFDIVTDHGRRLESLEKVQSNIKTEIKETLS